MNNLLLILGFIGTQEVIIIAIIILLLFGGKKIPELIRGIGKGVRSFKEGMYYVKNEMEKPIDQEKNGSENK